jgi:ribosome biogenesis protein NSA1
MTPSPAGLVSTALDRYARIHSTYPLPTKVGKSQDDKGAVLEKVYMKSIPTCVLWDGVVTDEYADEVDAKDGGMRQDGGDREGEDEDEDGDGDVWEDMQVVQDSEDENGESRALRKRKAQ